MEAFSSCDVQASPYGGFSFRGPWAPGLSGVEHRLRFSGMWDLPGWGIKPMSSALAGGFLTGWATREVLVHFHFIFLIK